MHAGMVGKSAIETLARVPAEVDIASEFRYRDPILEKNDLVIIISQSGETSDTLAALKLAKSRVRRAGAGHRECGWQLHCTCRRLCNVHLCRAGDRGSIHQGVYGADVRAVSVCIWWLAYARGRLNEAETRRYTPQLLRAPEVIKPRLADCEQTGTLPAAM